MPTTTNKQEARIYCGFVTGVILVIKLLFVATRLLRSYTFFQNYPVTVEDLQSNCFCLLKKTSKIVPHENNPI